MEASSITIRHSSEVDPAALVRLAQLDDRDPLVGESLLAFVGDELRAAVAVKGRGAIADPFHLTADVVELLRLRARQESKELRARHGRLLAEGRKAA